MEYSCIQQIKQVFKYRPVLDDDHQRKQGVMIGEREGII